MINWTEAAPIVLASFLASLVEFVEALTIVLAVGVVRGWRSVSRGVIAGVLFLACLIGIFGPVLQQFPVHILQLAIGVLLLLFGLKWLRKAVLRSAGVIKLHDEAAIFADQKTALRAIAPVTSRLDPIAFVTAFKAVVIEGVEVVFIVISTGAVTNNLIAASFGAALAGIIVISLGISLRTPLSKVPENTLKFSVGIILSAFGTFWLGEGLLFEWPGRDLSLLGLMCGFLAAARVSILVIRRTNRPGSRVPSG